jgi:hypothetical protein
MRITAEFESIEEFETFRTSGKKTRTKKDEADEAAGNTPTPLQPPAGGAAVGFPGAGGFAPQGAGAGQMGGAFPAAGAPVLAPEVVALVNRITARMDSAVSSGVTKADDMLTWFRGQCAGVDPSAANATLDQIKGVFLPKLSVPALDQIAKMMAA